MQCSLCLLELPAGTMRCSRCGTVVAASTPSSYSDDSGTLTYGEYVPYVDDANRKPSPPDTTATTIHTQVEYKQAKQSELPTAIRKSSSSPASPFVLLLVALLIVEGLGLLSYQFLFLPSALRNQTQQVTQSFLASQAQAAQLAQAHATMVANTMSPSQLYLKATSGTPVIDDSLTHAGDSVWYNYPFSSGLANSGCIFSNGAYHLRLPTGSGGYCEGEDTLFKDVAVQVHATILHGYAVGLLVRANYDGGSGNSHLYMAYIDVRGNYTITLSNNGTAKILQQGPNPTSVPGNQQSEVLTFIAYGSHLYFYVNQQSVATVTDTTDASPGVIGFFAYASSTGEADVTFNNAKVWSLS